MSLFPLARFERITDREAASRLLAWGHHLGPCRRRFAVHSFGLFLNDELVSVAVSASTVSSTCGGMRRRELVELARQCSSPSHRWATRVCIRLWREIAPRIWSREQWPVVACVSYADSTRHAGNIYRFDGWEKVADVRGGVTGKNSRTSSKRYNPKSLWRYRLVQVTRP